MGPLLISVSLYGKSFDSLFRHNGVVIDPADERQLAAALLRFYEDEGFRAEMGAAAAVRAREIAASELAARNAASIKSADLARAKLAFNARYASSPLSSRRCECMFCPFYTAVWSVA